jgi:hypothetical protein
VARLVTVFAIVLGIAGSAPAEDRPALTILLTTAPSVSSATRTALMQEATRIWEAAGIRLKWAAPTSVRKALSLRVLTIEHTGPAGATDISVLGELIRGAGTGAMAMIALDRATAIANRGPLNRGTLSFDQRLGLVLGRAVAHEVGHFLLAGSPHQDVGLMRARFPEAELTDAWSPAFEVNAPMRAVARTTIARGFPARLPATIPTASAGNASASD